MPSPVPPNDFKDLIPSLGSDLCDKFVRFLTLFPKKFYLWYSYIYDADGNFTDDFKLDLCGACPCDSTTTGGGGGGTTGLPAPVITATDGDFTDKVRIAWTLISEATSYEIYRNTVNDSASASLIGTTTTGTYDDLTATAGDIFYYWVKAKNSILTSDFSNVDTGYASAVLTAITTLKATKGYGWFVSPTAPIQLVFPKVTDATHYDIYRNSASDFSTATKIDAERIPFNNVTSSLGRLCSPFPCTAPYFVEDDAGVLTYQDTPPTNSSHSQHFKTWYYWVVAKKKSGSLVIGVTPESNLGTGWGAGRGTEGIGLLFGTSLTTNNQTYTVPSGVTQMQVSLHGGGAGGGGGSAIDSGGAGGGGAWANGTFAVVAGRQVKFVITGAGGSTGGAGLDGGAAKIVIQYETSPGVFTDYITVNNNGASMYGKAGASGGLAGVGGTYVLNGAVTLVMGENGTAGDPATGAIGGRGGRKFGSFRPGPQAADAAGVNGTYDGAGGNGSSTRPTTPTLANGGAGGNGYALLHAYSA